MATSFEDLKVLQSAEQLADSIWREVSNWDTFAQDVVGKQLARATDSIGANIAESFGRYHYGEKLQFLYYARGSLFETKYWLNRCSKRKLITDAQAQEFADQLTKMGRQINRFATSLKSQKQGNNTIKESVAAYTIEEESILSSDELVWLSDLNNADYPESLISNLKRFSND